MFVSTCLAALYYQEHLLSVWLVIIIPLNQQWTVFREWLAFSSTLIWSHQAIQNQPIQVDRKESSSSGHCIFSMGASCGLEDIFGDFLCRCILKLEWCPLFKKEDIRVFTAQCSPVCFHINKPPCYQHPNHINKSY